MILITLVLCMIEYQAKNETWRMHRITKMKMQNKRTKRVDATYDYFTRIATKKVLIYLSKIMTAITDNSGHRSVCITCVHALVFGQRTGLASGDRQYDGITEL